jgi:hypothetical protein
MSDLLVPPSNSMGWRVGHLLGSHEKMRLTLVIDLDHAKPEIIDCLLGSLDLMGGVSTNLRVLVEPGERGQLVDVYGDRMGRWILSDNRPCTVHGPVPLSHEQYKRAKMALWCEVCQDFYPINS